MKRVNKNATEQEVNWLYQNRKLLISIILIILVLCFMISVYLGIAVVLFLAANVIGFRIFFLYKQKESKKEIPEFINTQTTADIPKGLPLPYVYLDINRQIVGYNEKFSKLLGDRQMSLEEMGSLFQTIDFNKENQLIAVNGENFNCFVAAISADEKVHYGVLLSDGKEKTELLKKLDDQKPVVGLLYLDNYEEVVDSLEDSRIPALTAIIDKKLSDMTVAASGVMKKFEKDRYVFLFNTNKLREMQNKKFEILHEMREIRVGEHIPVTLSMGIGMGGDCLLDTMQNARAAIDLALGRGGDQVLVKDGEDYRFFGGKSGGVAHSSRIRARVKADALWEIMSEASDILIMGHKQADLDSLGASIGVYAIAKAMGRRSFIVLDQISGGIRKLYDRMIEDPSYGKAFITSAEAMKMVTFQSLVVITDTHRKGMTECPALLNEAKKVVLFDHHRRSLDAIDKAVMIYHEPAASSTAELVTEMIQYYGKKVRLKPMEADALLAGITVDTKNFCVKTGAFTFEAAAYLKRSGANSERVKKLFQNNMSDYQAKAAAVKDARIYLDNMAISVCHVKGENATLTTAQAADDLLNVSGIQASFVLCQMGDMIYVSARSFDEINVQRIMEKLDGGGHLTVAGAQLSGVSLSEAEEKVKEVIKQYLEEEQ